MPAAIVISFAGLFAAAVLSIGHVLDLPVPCGGSHGCAAVANHPSSRLFGVPIAFLGMAAYLAHVALIGRPALDRTSRLAATLLTAAGTLISAELLFYAHVVIGAHCAWCIVSALAMTALLLVDARLLAPAGEIVGVKPAIVWTLALATAAGIGVEAGWMERMALAPPIAAERLAGLDPVGLVDPAKSIGSPNAPVTVVIFADFWCPACRQSLGSLIRYQQAHPTAVRVAYRHFPLWQMRGHETSKAAAALSEMAAERGKFWAFAQAAHAHPQQMTREQYLELMARLGFEPTEVEARLAQPADRALAQVQREIDSAEQLGIQATPTFIIKIGAQPLVSATHRGLIRLLDSPGVMSLLRAAAPPR